MDELNTNSKQKVAGLKMNTDQTFTHPLRIPLITAAFWMLVFCLSPAQELIKMNEFSGNNGIEIHSAVHDYQDNIYFIASTYPRSSFTRTGYLIKTDSRLNVVFQKQLNLNSGQLILNDGLITRDNRILAAGSLLDGEGSRIVLMSVDASGNTDPPQFVALAKNATATAIAEFVNGDLAIGGFSSVSSVKSYNGLLIRISPAGEIIWQQEFGGDDEDAFLDVDISYAEEVVAVGYSRSADDQKDEGWAVICTSEGERIKEMFKGKKDNDRLQKVAIVSENAISVGGYLRNPGLLAEDSWHALLDSKLRSKWDKTSILPGKDKVQGIVYGLDGFIYLTGGWQDRNSSVAKPYIWKYDVYGKKITSRTYQVNFPVEITNLIQLNNGNLVFSGTGQRNQKPVGVAWLVEGPAAAKDLEKLELSLSCKSESGDMDFFPYDRGILNIELTNPGSVTYQRGILKISHFPHSRSVKIDTSIRHINLPPAGTRKLSVPVVVRGLSAGRTVSILVEALGTGYQVYARDTLKITTHQAPPIEFQNTDITVENLSRPSGAYSNKIIANDTVLIRCRILNQTRYLANGVQADVYSLTPAVIIVGEKRKTLGQIPPWESKPFEFKMLVQGTGVAGGQINFNLRVWHQLDLQGKLFDISLPVEEGPPARKMATKSEPMQPVPADESLDKKVSGEAFPAPDIAVENEIPQASAERPQAYGIIIGNQHYSKAPEVKFAIRDARLMKEYFMSALGLREGNILAANDATKADFETFFGVKDNPRGRLFNLIKPNVSDVFIYYAGHGAPGLKDKRGYFVPVDCDPQYVEFTGYPLDVFYNNLAQLPAKNIIVFIDACFSGANIYQNISPLIPVVKDYFLTRENIAVLTSSQGAQVSSWYPEKRHSLFTYFLAKGLHNFESDQNSDGAITVEELMNYVGDLVNGVPYWARRLHNVDQIPDMLGKNFDYILIKR